MYNDCWWNFLRSGNVRQPNSFFHCFKETLCTISIDMSSLNYLVRKYFKQVYAWTQLFWVYFLDLCQVSFRMYSVCTVAVSWKSIFLNFEQDFLASSSFPWSLLKTLNVHQA